MRRPRRRTLLRAGLGLFAVAVLLQLVPYGRDHPNPPVTRDAPWPDGRARELATAACTTIVHCVAIQSTGEATPTVNAASGRCSRSMSPPHLRSAGVDALVLSHRSNSLDA
jgi:hypothetical protein